MTEMEMTEIVTRCLSNPNYRVAIYFSSYDKLRNWLLDFKQSHREGKINESHSEIRFSNGSWIKLITEEERLLGLELDEVSGIWSELAQSRIRPRKLKRVKR